jgi:hypothetical protein
MMKLVECLCLEVMLTLAIVFILICVSESKTGKMCDPDSSFEMEPHVDSQAKQPCIGGSDFNLMLVVFIFWCFLVLQLDVKVYLVSPHYTNCMLLIIR